MLVLSMKPGEKLLIGENITVTVVEVRGKRVKIAIDAPDAMLILRDELTTWLDFSMEEDVEPDLVLSR